MVLIGLTSSKVKLFTKKLEQGETNNEKINIYCVNVVIRFTTYFRLQKSRGPNSPDNPGFRVGLDQLHEHGRFWAAASAFRRGVQWADLCDRRMGRKHMVA